MTASQRLMRCLLLLIPLALAGLRPHAAEAIPLLTGFGGPAGYGPNNLPANDDGSSPAIDIRPAFPMGLNFFGHTYTTMYVNNNGNLTFNGPLFTFTPNPFPVSSQPMIAPWWGDVDTRGGGQPARNGVWWYLEPNRIIVTWNNVGYFASHDDLQNDFQAILTSSSTCSTTGDFDVEYRYNRCEWTTGDASSGMGGLGGTPAQVGFDAGDSTHFVSLPMSRTMAILGVCTSSNVPGGANGLWRFQIRGGGVAGGCAGAGMPCTIPTLHGVCAQGVTQCAGMGVACVQVNFPRSPRCNGFDNMCTGTIDSDNSLCPTGQVCSRGQCVPHCQPELGCLPGQTCTPEGVCVETACVMVTCPEGQRCSAGRCIGLCDGVTCPHGQLCRAGRCVDPCAGIMCNPREVCADGLCVPACQCRPCATGQQCQPDGTCVPTDCVGVTCPTGTYCQGGNCLDACDHGPDTRLCPPGETCNMGSCIPGMDPAGGRDGGTHPGDAAVHGDGAVQADGGGDGGITNPNDSGGAAPDGSAGDDGGAPGVTFGGARSSGCACRASVSGAAGGSSRVPLMGIVVGLVAALRRRSAR